mgnify:CR=1 FL=1
MKYEKDSFMKKIVFMVISMFALCSCFGMAGEVRERTETAKQIKNQEASAIISKMIDSYGGLEKLQAIKGWSFIILREVYPLGETQICKHYVRLPDKFRFELEVDREEKKEVFQLIYNAGSIKYLKDGKETEKTSSEIFLTLERMVRWYQRTQAPTQFKYFNNIKNEMKLIGKKSIKGKECYVLEYLRADGTKARICVDTETFRAVKLEVDNNYNDKFLEIFLGEQTFKENGIEIPVIRRYYNDGELMSKTEHRSISLTLPDESLFEF